MRKKYSNNTLNANALDYNNNNNNEKNNNEKNNENILDSKNYMSV